MNKLTKEDALHAVQQIQALQYDPEAAHSTEDAYYLQFIKCIAAGMYTKQESIEIANILKSTQDVDFDRWTA